MTTTPTMPTTDQPAPTTTSTPPATGQFPSAPPFPPPAASAYPPPASGPVPGYYPAGEQAAFGPSGFAAAPSPTAPPAPARRRTAFLVAGCTLLAVAVLQLIRLPEWITYDQHGLVGNLTGVVALVGIGTALIITGRQQRR